MGHALQIDNIDADTQAFFGGNEDHLGNPITDVDNRGPVLFAGGGIQGGTVVGSSDKKGAYPASALQTPENFAATIYQALGIPRTAHWYDAALRPYHIYHADPIEGLV